MRIIKLMQFLFKFSFNSPIVNAETLTIMQCVHVYQDLAVGHPIVVPSVSFHQNVHRLLLVSIKSASIHVYLRVA